MCVLGYFSWRNSESGSWFIQSLVRVLSQHSGAADMDLVRMLTLVNDLVATEFESCTDDEFTSGMKQVPCVVTTLTKLLYLAPKH